MGRTFAILAYTGLLLTALSCMLMLDILAVVSPQSSALPIVALLGLVLPLPLIVSRGRRS